MDKYTEILKLVVDHEFFIDQRCDAITIYPNNDSMCFWDSVNLLFKKINSNTWSIFLGVGNFDKKKLEIFLNDDELLLNFSIHRDKSKFLLYTYWPYSAITDLLVVQVPVNKLKNECIQLNFDETYSGELNCKALSNKLNSGLFMHLEIDIKEVLSRFLNIDENFKPLEVKLNFSVIHMVWEYIIIQKKEWNCNEIELKDKTGNLEFTPLEQIDFLEEDRVYRSVSTKPVNLSDAYAYKIQLWSNKKSKKQLIYADIPLPNLENMSINSMNDKKMITNYIYY